MRLVGAFGAGLAVPGALILLALAAPAFAVIESYEFESEELRARYQTFTEVLRCPKCQNQNLSGSNSPIAADLRREVHRLLHEGYSDAEIQDFMVARYGEFILYEPPLNRHTMVLWFFPLALLLIGGSVLVVVLRRRGTQAGASTIEEDAAARDRASRLICTTTPATSCERRATVHFA